MTHHDTEFQGFLAEFYDLLHEGCDDARLYPILLKQYGHDILELGSGTGRIAIPLAEAGFRVTGVEYEQDMIALMERKPYPRDRLKVLQGDARNFRLDQRFDVALLACNFIDHFPDARDVVTILANCKRHMKETGCVIVDCSAPDTGYMAASSDREETFTFPTARGTEIRDYFRPRYDLLNQIEEDEIILEEWQDGRLLRSARTEEKLTWYHPREIRSLIREAGLSIRWESDRLPLDGQAHPIGPDADNMIFCCEIREPISTDITGG